MSKNCIRCVRARRTGADLLCDDCRKRKPAEGSIPVKPGYYWAKWRIPAKGTHEGEQLCPSNTWEIVQVNANHLYWERDPMEEEALSVMIPGVRETQWRDCFIWGKFVANLELP